MSIPDFGTPRYGLTRKLTNTTIDEVKARATEALSTEGFGILTEIDIQATFSAKLGKSIGGYTILGACSPSLAHQALQFESAIGLMMPCNVVISEQSTGDICVSIADPVYVFQPLDRPDMNDFALQIQTQLQRALDQI